MLSALTLHNGDTADAQKVPSLSPAEFRQSIVKAVANGARIASLFGYPLAPGTIRLVVVLADGMSGSLAVLSRDAQDSYLALMHDCPQADPFEREVSEQYGLQPEGHPAPNSLRNTAAAQFPKALGEEVHEVAVGPVHAGIIEPGHFRFLAHGEEVLNLEIALGYQHRGVERALVGAPDKRTIHYMETLCGDSSIGHATAYAQAVEALSLCRVPPRAEALRAIALELERLANHTGDLGALAGDIAYLPTASYCGRLRGDFLNMTALLCGNRFGRNLVRPGGVRFDLDKERASRLLKGLEAATRDVTQSVSLLWNTPSVLARFEGVGGVSRAMAETLGMVGPAARASGLERDVRFEFPAGFYRYAQIPVCTWHTGDVFSRAYLRWLEIQRSLTFVRERLMTLPTGDVRVPCENPRPGQITVSLVEGWRGGICHVAITDEGGRFLRYKVVDPSFHNWKGLALAMRGGQISDFPLINKSFNLSYAGHDL